MLSSLIAALLKAILDLIRVNKEHIDVKATKDEQIEISTRNRGDAGTIAQRLRDKAAKRR